MYVGTFVMGLVPYLVKVVGSLEGVQGEVNIRREVGTFIGEKRKYSGTELKRKGT